MVPWSPCPHGQTGAQECISDCASPCRGPAPAVGQVERRDFGGWSPAIWAEVSPKNFTAVAHVLMLALWCIGVKRVIHYLTLILCDVVGRFT